MTSEAAGASSVQQLVRKHLALPLKDDDLERHISGILLEESPINPAELYEMIADFLALFRSSRAEWIRKCEELYIAMRNEQLLSEENKFSLTADKLDQTVVLEKVLSMDDARQPLFAKKTTGGNSNNQMEKWKKKEKGRDK
jgi:hypothetical protein